MSATVVVSALSILGNGKGNKRERERGGVTQNDTAPPIALESKESTGARNYVLLKHKPVFLNPS